MRGDMSVAGRDARDGVLRASAFQVSLHSRKSYGFFFFQAEDGIRYHCVTGVQTCALPISFPSPADWRDNWIYFLLVDRFNNPLQPPRNLPWDAQYSDFQGGTIDGIRTQLD